MLDGIAECRKVERDIAYGNKPCNGQTNLGNEKEKSFPIGSYNLSRNDFGSLARYAKIPKRKVSRNLLKLRLT